MYKMSITKYLHVLSFDGVLFAHIFVAMGFAVNQTKRNLPYSLSLFLPLSEIINVWLLCRRFIVG